MTNPLLEELEVIVPTVSVALPTLGRWYHEDVFEEGVDPTDLEVKAIGIVAEQRYRDPYLLASGKALPYLIHQVCPSIIKPEELCDMDVEVILIATRLVSYGEEMMVPHKCAKEECDEENQIPLNLTEFIMRYSPMEDVSEYEMTLMPMQHKVYLRPMPYRTSINVIKRSFMSEVKSEEFTGATPERLILEPELADSYASMLEDATLANIDAIEASIFCVETRSGKKVYASESIREWLETIPGKCVEEIGARMRDLSNRLRDIPLVKYKCGACGHENKFVLQMDPQRLFSSAGASKAPTKPSQKSGGTANRRKRPLKRSQASSTATTEESSTNT